MTNPLLSNWETQYELPPFDAIRDSHFSQAFETALDEARANIAKIANDPTTPTFANTVVAMEEADHLLDRVAGVFYNLAGSDANPTRQALERELAPKMAAFSSEILMNQKLYARIATLWDQRNALDLSSEELRVLELYRRMFRRAGAELADEGRETLKGVQERLAVLGTQFSQNLLADEADWSLPLAEADLDGLPDFVVAAAKAAAAEKGTEGHLLTLSRSLIVPFLQFSPRRDLREVAFRAWVARGASGGETDNRGIVAEILKLRETRAKLLGYSNFATFKLEPEMAKTPKAVRDLLMAVWEPAKMRAAADADILTAVMQKDGINGPIEPWDWRYYAEKRRKAEFDIDEVEVKPYFSLEAMIAAAFDCATRLFKLDFEEISVPLYHDDARAWKVTRDGRLMAIFIGDYFARASKRSGAWCSSMRSQKKLGGDVRPIVLNTCNFVKPPTGQPALLSFDDARTLFHEFGHALHVILSDVTYPFISGTSVARDFVELPSQLYEHWLEVPEVLEKYARHVETGAPMPKELLEKLLAAKNADMGHATVEYVSSALVDLSFHEGSAPDDPMAVQAAELKKLNAPHAIPMRHATPHFAHVFSGDGYSSGYYSYMWSEVMDADAFMAFEEAGDPFDPETAQLLERHILSAGGSEAPEDLYKKFRGRMPGVEALLKGRGLIDAA